MVDDTEVSLLIIITGEIDIVLAADQAKVFVTGRFSLDETVMVVLSDAFLEEFGEDFIAVSPERMARPEIIFLELYAVEYSYSQGRPPCQYFRGEKISQIILRYVLINKSFIKRIGEIEKKACFSVPLWP